MIQRCAKSANLSIQFILIRLIEINRVVSQRGSSPIPGGRGINMPDAPEGLG